MVAVVHDLVRCQRHRRVRVDVPENFRYSDAHEMTVLGERVVSEEQHGKVREAVGGCPDEASAQLADDGGARHARRGERDGAGRTGGPGRALHPDLDVVPDSRPTLWIGAAPP